MNSKQLILKFNYPDLLPYASCYQNCSDSEILSMAGNKFVAVAQSIKDDFETWWNNWSNPTEFDDCLLPSDWEETFLSKYLQQSIDVTFLDKYLVDDHRLSHDYPESRTTYIQEEIEGDLLAKNITDIINTAHSESIKEWSDTVLKVIEKFQEIKFSYLLNLVELSPAKVYLGVLLSDSDEMGNPRFTLINNRDDFYGDFKIKIN